MEKPPAALSPEEEARRETEQLDAIRDRRVKNVFDMFVAQRTDLTSEQKSSALASMQANPEYEWGQVDGEDVVVTAVHKTPDNHLKFDFGMYGMEWGSPRLIKLP